MKTAHIIDKIGGEIKFSITSRDDIPSMIDSEKEVAIFSDNFPEESMSITTIRDVDIIKLRAQQAEELSSEIKQSLPIVNLLISDVSDWVDSNVKTQKDMLEVLKQLIILQLKR